MSDSKVKKDMTFGELLQQFPDSAPILYNYGLHCIGCHLSVTETIEQGARAHGLDDGTIEKMISELNGAAVA